VFGNVDRPSSLAASLSMVVELLEGRIDTVPPIDSIGELDLCWLLFVALLRAEVRAGVAWVRVKSEPN
jgi:hypothetical protein